MMNKTGSTHINEKYNPPPLPARDSYRFLPEPVGKYGNSGENDRNERIASVARDVLKTYNDWIFEGRAYDRIEAVRARLLWGLVQIKGSVDLQNKRHVAMCRKGKEDMLPSSGMEIKESIESAVAELERAYETTPAKRFALFFSLNSDTFMRIAEAMTESMAKESFLRPDLIKDVTIVDDEVLASTIRGILEKSDEKTVFHVNLRERPWEYTVCSYVISEDVFKKSESDVCELSIVKDECAYKDLEKALVQLGAKR